MSQELIYTSVPSGLKPGSKGFCTVAMTTGLPPGWAERLESLSGYRPVYALGDPNSENNPINWSHWRIVVAGKSRSVLSRVGFAGADYSGRSNKLAHHIVVDPAEQAAGGPAWMELRPGVLLTAWTGAPHQLPSGPKLPTGDRAPHACTAWARARGDAGWACILAESFATEPTKTAYVIYTPGTDVLTLFEESLSLLPSTKRWEVTFSTFFTELPLNQTCAWRAVVVGTPAAADAMRLAPRTLVLDLTKPPGASPTGIYADAARTGTGPVLSELGVSRGAVGTRIAATVTTPSLKPDDTAFELADDHAATSAAATGGRKRLLPTAGSRDMEEELPDADDLAAQPSGIDLPPQTVVYRGIPTWLALSIAVLCLIIGGFVGGKLAPLISKRPPKAPGQSGPVTADRTPEGPPDVSTLAGSTQPALPIQSVASTAGTTPALAESLTNLSITKPTAERVESGAPTTSSKVAEGNKVPTTQRQLREASSVEELPSVEEEIQEAKIRNPSLIDDKIKQISFIQKPGEAEPAFTVNLPSECNQPAGLALAWPNGEGTFPLVAADQPYTLSEARNTKTPLTLVISAPVPEALETVVKPLVNLQVGHGKLLITRVENGHDALIREVINTLGYSEFLVRTKNIEKYDLKQYCINVGSEKKEIDAHHTFERPVLPQGIDIDGIMIDGVIANWTPSPDHMLCKFTCPLTPDNNSAEFTVKLHEWSDAKTRWEVLVDISAFENLKTQRDEADKKKLEADTDVTSASGKLKDRRHDNPNADDLGELQKKLDGATAKQEKATNEAHRLDDIANRWIGVYKAASQTPLTLSMRLPNGVEISQVDVLLPPLGQ